MLASSRVVFLRVTSILTACIGCSTQEEDEDEKACASAKIEELAPMHAWHRDGWSAVIEKESREESDKEIKTMDAIE